MRTRTIVTLAAAGGLLVGCSKEEPQDTGAPEGGTVGETVESATNDVSESAGDLAETAGDAAEDVGDALSEEAARLRDEAVEAARSRLSALEARLAELRQDLEEASLPVKTAASPLVDAAAGQLAGLGERIENLQSAGADAWESASAELDEAIAAAERAITEAASRIGG